MPEVVFPILTLSSPSNRGIIFPWIENIRERYRKYMCHQCCFWQTLALCFWKEKTETKTKFMVDEVVFISTLRYGRESWTLGSLDIKQSGRFDQQKLRSVVKDYESKFREGSNQQYRSRHHQAMPPMETSCTPCE